MSRSEKHAASLVWRTRWEQVTDTPLLVLGALFIVAYSVLVLAPGIPGWLNTVILVLVIVTWLSFVADAIIRVSLTPRGERGHFIRSNVPDMLSAIVPLFRAFRVLRLLRQIPYLHRRSGTAVRARVMTYAAGYVLVFIYFVTLATLHAERGAPGSTITTFGDGLWWACVTIATVGYGDVYPVTTLGRFYAVTLMAGGIVIVGTTSAVVISYLNDRMHQLSQRHQDAAKNDSMPGADTDSDSIDDATGR